MYVVKMNTVYRTVRMSHTCTLQCSSHDFLRQFGIPTVIISLTVHDVQDANDRCRRLFSDSWEAVEPK